MGTAILSAMTMNVASHQYAESVRKREKDSRKKYIKEIKESRKDESGIFNDYKKTVEHYVLDRAYDIGRLLNKVPGIRTCCYLAAIEVHREFADEVLAELNQSLLEHNNYFDGDNWYGLGAMQFLSKFSQKLFNKYHTCYWKELQEVLKNEHE